MPHTLLSILVPTRPFGIPVFSTFRKALEVSAVKLYSCIWQRRKVRARPEQLILTRLWYCQHWLRWVSGLREEWWGSAFGLLKDAGWAGTKTGCPTHNSLSFPSAVGKKWKGQLMEENSWSSNFCDDCTTNSLECPEVRCVSVLHPQLVVCCLTWSLSPLDGKGFQEVGSGTASCHTLAFLTCHLFIVPAVLLDVDSLSFWVLKWLFWVKYLMQ